MISSDELDLLTRFSDAARKAWKGERISPEAISKSIGGKPSGPTIRRFVAKKFPKDRLDSATRKGMEAYLTSRNQSDGDDGPPMVEAQPATTEGSRTELARYRKYAGSSGDGVSWVPRLIEKVLDSDRDVRAQVALIEAIIAGGRNHTAYGEAMAALQRGAALDGETAAANGRNGINRAELDEAARRRQEGLGASTAVAARAAKASRAEAEDAKKRGRKKG